MNLCGAAVIYSYHKAEHDVVDTRPKKMTIKEILSHLSQSSVTLGDVALLQLWYQLFVVE